MEGSDFEEHGREMLHYTTSYLNNIRQRRALPDVEPGFMRELIPDRAPEMPESWEDVMKDVERVIMPGVSCPVLGLYLGLLGSFLCVCVCVCVCVWREREICTRAYTQTCTRAYTHVDTHSQSSLMLKKLLFTMVMKKNARGQ